MYAPTEMSAPRRRPMKYVYVKMTRAQVDSKEGKLVRGDVLILDEEKAMRWVYRARIARPSTAAEYEQFQNTMRRTNAGSRRLRNQPMVAPPPEENPFEYVDQDNNPGMDDEDEFENSSVNDDDSLGAQLDAAAVTDEDEDDDSGPVSEIFDPGYDPAAQNQGVYGESITRGPGERVSPEEEENRGPLTGRGRARRR